jgi:thiamine-monophosphate kinase
VCPAGEVVYRRGARAGDAIFLTGWPGESAAGLALLGAAAAGRDTPAPVPVEDGPRRDRLQARHLDPEPRLSAGRRIAAGRLATAMIDVSDGVLADLGHILESSGAGARVDAAAVPLSPDLVNACRGLGLDPLRLALAGGEDYELLFTGPPSPGAAELSGVLGVPVSRIGTVTDLAGRLEIVDPEGRAVDLPHHGFEHFHL